MATFEVRRTSRGTIDIYHYQQNEPLATFLDSITADEAIEFAADLLEYAAAIKAED